MEEGSIVHRDRLVLSKENVQPLTAHSKENIRPQISCHNNLVDPSHSKVFQHRSRRPGHDATRLFTPGNAAAGLLTRDTQQLANRENLVKCAQQLKRPRINKTPSTKQQQHTPMNLTSPSSDEDDSERIICARDSRHTFSEARVMALEGKLQAIESDRQRLQQELLASRQERTNNPRKLDVSSQTETHPAFGTLLIDFGHKRLYLASARTFVASVPIWSKQRPCNDGRVVEICKAKRHSPEFIGSISCFQIEGQSQPSISCPQPCGIFDGQHRAKAISLMLKSEDFTVEDSSMESDDEARGLYEDFNVLVEVWNVRSESDVKSLYLEVNKSESVKEIDMPDAIAPIRKTAIDNTVALLNRRFPMMFKPSERCRPPHVHRDTLRNVLFQHPSTESVVNEDDLLKRILKVNEILGKTSKKFWSSRVHKALEKACLHEFWLGLNDYAWLDRL